MIVAVFNMPIEVACANLLRRLAGWQGSDFSGTNRRSFKGRQQASWSNISRSWLVLYILAILFTDQLRSVRDHGIQRQSFRNMRHIEDDANDRNSAHITAFLLLPSATLQMFGMPFLPRQRSRNPCAHPGICDEENEHSRQDDVQPQDRIKSRHFGFSQISAPVISRFYFQPA